MNADDIFGILILFVSALGALFFIISTVKKEAMTFKFKSNSSDRKLKIRQQ
ncbi:hypothetical protein J2X31_001385 [Flavobacterium arsenatis]|uniref:Uncharacterized protein n=1 Tax=Flavobacterium arsenatis TaxID=1484332 RepID=A0ABU1TN35_9FLAO|nr:hypothetical protein [Flavobacterium arsenatis]MDR6967374.1 hypothetical protein [Flavobacterium arsenatis]